MSEDFSVINLVLGIIGTITGIIAIFISFWTFYRQNPHLKIKVLKCEHELRKGEKKIIFWATFQVKNIGDRGTSINDIDLTFEDNGKEYRFKKEYFMEEPTITSELFKTADKKWINPHETIEINTNYYENFEGDEKEQIECTFTLYHTHGSKNIKSISQKIRE